MNNYAFNKLAIGAVFMFTIGGSQPSSAANEGISQITRQLLEVINASKDGQQAEENLCKQGGVVRGSGWSAGDTCKLQDFARVATVICEKYQGFWDSKCGKNTKIVTNPKNARIYINDAVKNEYPNVTLLTCSPPREKLPAGLKSIAEESCQKAVATEAPGLPPRSRANAKSGVDTKALEPRPAAFIVQSALRNLPEAQASSISAVQKGEAFMEAAKAAMLEFNEIQNLVGAGKSAPMAGVIKMAPPLLINELSNLDQRADLVLMKIQIRIETNGHKTIEQKEEDELAELNREMADLREQFKQYLDLAIIDSRASASSGDKQ